MTTNSDAQQYLYDMLDTLPTGLDRRQALQLVELKMQEYVDQASNPDAARNALLRAITDSVGVILFVSPDTNETVVTTGTALMQMLQIDSLFDALNATDGVIVC